MSQVSLYNLDSVASQRTEPSTLSACISEDWKYTWASSRITLQDTIAALMQRLRNQPGRHLLHLCLQIE